MEKFVGDFYHVYDYKKDFLDHEGRDCFEDSSLSTKPVVCKEATFQYPRQDSVLAFYRHVPGNKCKGKRCGGPLLELTGPSNETFRVRTPGIYTLSVNITIVDETHNHSLALFLNGHAVLACPKGGFRCPKTNEKDSVKYRICNINGLVELNDNDILQLRTLERNTTVRLESHRQSLFEAVLLHQTGEAIKKKANKQKANDPQKKRVTKSGEAHFFVYTVFLVINIIDNISNYCMIVFVV
ncbi:hypothetical protein Btru_039192 [Bulinus truncatus]|nr:hypothetical protein Btru_039192 [Bulinus truncatus]